MTIPCPVKPPRLKPGDTIGVVAPSGPVERDEFEKGLSVLHNWGLETQLGEGLFERKGYLAGRDDRRLAQLNRMFADEDIDAVMSARGGFGALKIVPGLDYDSIGRQPKAFVGYSDITVLHQALYQKLGLVTFHGPMVTGLAGADELTLESWRATLMGGQPVRLIAENPRSLIPGSTQGVVLGGNLATLCHLIGTSFSPDFGGAILLIEETHEPLYRIDRMLTQMKLAGCFHDLAGVVLGSFSDCGPTAEIHELIYDCFKEVSVPVAAGFTCGHTGRNSTIPLGLPARLDADGGELVFIEAATLD